VICPLTNNAQNNMQAVSAQGSMHWVLMRRLNSSCSRSMALVVRMDFHWSLGKRRKVKSFLPASSRLSATGRQRALCAFAAAPICGQHRGPRVVVIRSL